MNPTKTMMCARCHALRWVEDWREDRDEMMLVTLGPCGHRVERQARLEWTIPSWKNLHMRRDYVRPASAGVATS